MTLLLRRSFELSRVGSNGNVLFNFSFFFFRKRNNYVESHLAGVQTNETVAGLFDLVSQLLFSVSRTNLITT